MKVNCLHCGHAFGLDDSYGDYEGLVRCPTCAGLLDVRIESEMIRAVRPGSLTPVAAPSTQPAAQPPAAPDRHRAFTAPEQAAADTPHQITPPHEEETGGSPERHAA